MQRKIFIILGLVFFVLGALFINFHSKSTEAEGEKPKENVKYLMVYSTLPANISQIIEQEYNRDREEKVRIISISNEELRNHLQSRTGFDDGSLILASGPQLRELAQENLLKGSLPEYGEWLRDDFKDIHDRWLGIWYDPVVFCYNMDYVKSNWNIPNTWQDLHLAPKLRITTMDFLNTAAGANILYALAEERGDNQALQLLKSFHGQVVRYGKYLSTPVRMVGMGEADMSIAMQSEVLKYRSDKYPLTIIYPQEGTAYLLTGVGMLKPVTPEAKNFVEWLLKDDIQLVLQNQQLYFMPTNEATLAAEKYSHSKIRLFKIRKNLNEQQRDYLLNRWVKEVRLGN